MRYAATTAITLSLGVCLTLAAIEISPAAPPHMKKSMGNSAMIATGKSLSNEKGCNKCHGADLKGRPHFSPSLLSSGVLHEYNAKTWARVLDTGVTYNNGKVKPPMPVYHLKAADSAALYAYCKALK